MRHLLTALALVIALAGPATAQQHTAPQSWPVVGGLDYPAWGSTVSSSIYFAGWSLDCNTKSQASTISLWRSNNTTGQMVGVNHLRYPVPRPDVIAAYSGACPGLSGDLGWHMYPTDPQPAGDYTYSILISNLPTQQSGHLSGVLVVAGELLTDYGSESFGSIIAQKGQSVTTEGRIPDPQAKSNTVTITLTDEQHAALDWWVSEERRRGPIDADRPQRTPNEYLTLVIAGHLADIVNQYRQSEVSATAQTARPILDRIKKLAPGRCAALAKELGVEMSSLPCGGGR